MPRVPSENTEAINMKIPPSWFEKADRLRQVGILPAVVTRTEMFREALGFGLDVLLKEGNKHRARQRRRGKKKAK